MVIAAIPASAPQPSGRRTLGYPKHSTLRQVPAAAWLLPAGLLAVCGAALGWQALPFGVAVMYAASGPLLLLLGAPARRKLLHMVG